MGTTQFNDKMATEELEMNGDADRNGETEVRAALVPAEQNITFSSVM